jgi:hypothetical protein
MVKSLYKHAHNRVVINSVLSRTFKVERGVRQGDPLSCTLFDIVIEPLACLLRNDPEVHSLKIPGLPEKLIVKLFADNTNLYLSKLDRLDIIHTILNKWCTMSGAKFNSQKMDIIPIGSPDFCHSVTKMRKINNQDAPLPTLIWVAEDGDVTRMLGAWIGNKVNDLTTWELTIDKINKTLGKWKCIHPTLNRC